VLRSQPRVRPPHVSFRQLRRRGRHGCSVNRERTPARHGARSSRGRASASRAAP